MRARISFVEPPTRSASFGIFIRHDAKPLSCIACACGLNRCVDSKNIGLFGELVDDLEDATNLLRFLSKIDMYLSLNATHRLVGLCRLYRLRLGPLPTFLRQRERRAVHSRRFAETSRSSLIVVVISFGVGRGGFFCTRCLLIGR